MNNKTQSWFAIIPVPVLAMLGVVLALTASVIHVTFFEASAFWPDGLMFLCMFGLAVTQFMVYASSKGAGGSKMSQLLDDLSAAANNAGDLSCRTSVVGDDTVGQVGEAFNQCMENTGQLLQEVVNSNAGIESALHSMQGASTKSESQYQQQAEIEQLATAMTEMAATVQDVAKNASKAETAARDANEQAQEGQAVVSSTLSSINSLASEVSSAADVVAKLEEDSEGIGKVLDVIRGIAEQTNLLALNAAIEAARAGEQGRGFAVVADEVRTLASRTQESTEEVQQMIEQLQSGARKAVQVMDAGREQSRNSVDEATKAGAELEAITSAVSIISDMNTQIASAAEEQSMVAEEINRNIVSISQMVGQTDEPDASQNACANVAGMASILGDSVNRFRF